MPAEGSVNLNLQPESWPSYDINHNIGHDAYQYNIPHFSYDTKPLLNAFELSLPKSSWTSILGPSGIGKTTILRLIAGFIPDFQSNQDLKIAYLPQSELLLPWAKAIDNVLIGNKIKNNQNKKDNKDKAIQIFEKLGLVDYMSYYPHQLSGGMKQRIQIARVLLEDADLVLMDEPFSQLDALTRIEANTFAKNCLKDKTILLVTHDPMEALRLSDQILILDGKPASIKDQLFLTEADRHRPELIHALYKKLGVSL